MQWSWASLSFGQDFCRTDGVQLSTQVVEDQSKSLPTPCKTHKNQLQRTTTISTRRLQLSETEKIEKICEGWGV
jgi:hypothetical protein